MKQTHMKIAFLFGSGISDIPTENLTKQVLSGDGFVKISDSTYVKNKVPVGRKEPVILITKLLKVLEQEIRYSSPSHRTPNYEDIYYMAVQITNHLAMEFENPSIVPLINNLKPSINKILSLKENSFYNIEWNEDRLLNETCNYIEDVIGCELSLPYEKSNHLKIIKEACEDKNILLEDIFTLNHDKFIEHYLSLNKLNFIDGFADQSPEKIRYFNSKSLKSNSLLKLIKLHGSINWFLFDEKIGNYIGKDRAHIKKNKKEEFYRVSPRPEILIGTFNKMINYLHTPFFELFTYFRKKLNEIDVLIISGYSFGDKGINQVIMRWLVNNKNRRIIVIHNHPEELKNSARGLIQRYWNRFVFSKKWIQDCEWIEIKNLLKKQVVENQKT